MSSAVEKFLAQKRAEQQKSFSPQINSIAPPIHERYGIKPPMSGEYTGKGADGVTQATMPTQNRIDSNGKPYIVDENEMLVVDSKTLNDYGGPEALDKFIQTNRPGRQFACGGVPTKDRYFTGGIPSNRQAENTQLMPTRPRAISSDQMRLLGEIRDGARRFQEGGTPASSGNPDWGDKFNEIKSLGKPFNTGQIKQNLDPINFSFNTDKPIKQNLDPLNLNLTIPNNQVIKTDPLKQNLDPLNLSFNVPDPVKIKTDPLKQNLDPLNLSFNVPDVGGDVSLGGTGAKSFSPKDIDEMMFQRQMARMGSQQESERAAEAQRGLQAGLSEREVQGQGAISDVGRREAQAGATADFAINQAQRLDEQDKANQLKQEQQREFDEGTRRFNVQTGQWEKQFGLEEKKFNTQTGQWEKTFNLEETKYNNGKQKDSLSTMLAAGDYKGAGKLFKDIYGSDIDFSYLEDSKKAGQWSEGFNNMISLISSGTKWEDALNIMKKDGSFAKMGMTETDLYKFYSQAQLNNDPMYKYVNTVDGWVKNKLISQDDADDMIALFKYNLTNPNGLEVLDGFAVKDKGGKEVGFFTTQADADKFITANKDKGYVSTPVKNHVGVKGSSGGGGGSGGGNNTEIESFLGRPATQEEVTLFKDNPIANSFVKKDFSTYGVEDIKSIKETYNLMPKDWKEKNSLGQYISKIDTKEGAFYKEYEKGNIVKSAPDGTSSIEKYLKNINNWQTKEPGQTGNKKLTDEMRAWSDANKGKYVKLGNKHFVYEGNVYNPPSTGETGNLFGYFELKFRDPKTNQILIVSSQKKNLNSTDAVISDNGFGSSFGMDETQFTLGNMGNSDFWPVNSYLSSEKLV
jgi:hypothetical protein